MNITVDQAQGRVPVTILGIHGDLDGSNYQTLIAKAKEMYDAGARDLILDMSQTPFMSSAGLVALHNIALLLQNELPPDPQSGWEAFHAISRDQNAGMQPHIKLLNPQPKVASTLEITGMKQLFEIHGDLQTAVASF